jgi:death-on-curing protein
VKFILLDEVLVIHDKMLTIGGGHEGIHDFTFLHFAIERPKAQFGGEYLYTTIWFMAAAMLHSLVKNHPFNDGNKRTAFFTTLRFLNKNGYIFTAAKNEIVEFMVSIDVKNIDIEQIAVWLEKYSKEIKK